MLEINQLQVAGRQKLKRMSIFAGRLEALRKARGYVTQSDFAAALGLRQSQISYYEAGSIPKSEILIRISQVLNTSIDYLLGLTDYDGAPLAQDERKLLDAFYRGDSETVIRMIDERLLKAIEDDPSLLDDSANEQATITNGE